MADQKGYITYGEEHGISKEKAEDLFYKAEKSVEKQVGKTKSELTGRDWEHIMGIFKKMISNMKESVTILSKPILVENTILNKNSKIYLKESDTEFESLDEFLPYIDELQDILLKKHINCDVTFDNKSLNKLTIAIGSHTIFISESTSPGFIRCQVDDGANGKLWIFDKRQVENFVPYVLKNI
jgi:hypothetical protein